jgi:hypothetical protein
MRESSQAIARRLGKRKMGRREPEGCRRLVQLARIAAQAATNSNRKVPEPFSVPAEQQGSYGFFANVRGRLDAITVALGRPAAAKCSVEQKVRAIIHGSSFGVTAHVATRGVGSVGCLSNGGLGLNGIRSVGASEDGTPIGLLDQQGRRLERARVQSMPSRWGAPHVLWE